MSGTVAPYLALVTSEHAGKPNYTAVLTAILQPLADTLAAVQGIPAAFDLDQAVGAQLDVDGLWIGQSRNIAVPIVGVYFSFDTVGLGWDEGTWLGAFDPPTELDTLPDDAYRTVLKFKAALNSWDGSIESANAIWTAAFADKGLTIITQDLGSMKMTIGVLGTGTIDAVTRALLTQGILRLKPAGVQITGIVFPSPPGEALFGFDSETAAVSGWDVGAWGALLADRLGFDFILGRSRLA